MVRASNVVGNVDQPFEITIVGDTIAPTAPADLAVDDTTQATATLNWTASSDAGGVDHYDVFSVVHRRQRWRRWNVYTLAGTVSAETTTFTLTDLSPLTNTYYVVRAIDAMGNVSAYSAEVYASTLSVPDLTFRAGTQATGTVQSSAKAPLALQLFSRANPTAAFSLVAGPATMQVDPITGLVSWTPTADDVGLIAVTFRATNSIGNAELAISIDIIADTPQLFVTYNPTTGGQRDAIAGMPFTAQISDQSNSPSTFILLTAPTGMTLDASTGLISWTPVGNQGGPQTVTVRGTNAGGIADLTFNVQTLFTDAVTNVVVTGTTLLQPTANWIAPTGEGADLVAGYRIEGVATWGIGRNKKTHRVSYSVSAPQTSVLMTGLTTGRVYTLTVTATDAVGNLGLRSTATTFASSPALPIVQWTVNALTGGTSVPGRVIAGYPAQIVLTDSRPEPSTIRLVSGPAGLIFNPATNTADWTPGAVDVTSGFDTTPIVFEAINSIGSVNLSVPIRVFFSGAVRNASTTRYGSNATAHWDAPSDNVTPIEGYRITRHWTWSGRKRSVTWTVGNVTSIAFALYPTGAIVHKGISVEPIDANGNLGVSSGTLLYGAPANNLPPTAVDDAYDTTEDVALSIDMSNGVLANDVDTDNTPFINPLGVRLVTGPPNGTVTLADNGAFTYTPNADFNGVDTFAYLLDDGSFFGNIATVTINVGAVNDTPSALDDYYIVDQDTTQAIDAASGVLENDFDVDHDTLAVSVVTGPENGTLSLSADGAFTYTPNTNFAGTDTFTYVATDSLLDSRTASVTIFVNSTVDAPATPANFHQIEGEDDSITFVWDATTDGRDVDHYKLYRYEYVSGLQYSWRVVADNIIMTEHTLMPAMTGRYRIIAFDAAGNRSPVSNEIEVTRLADFDNDDQVGRRDVAIMVQKFWPVGKSDLGKWRSKR